MSNIVVVLSGLMVVAGGVLVLNFEDEIVVEPTMEKSIIEEDSDLVLGMSSIESEYLDEYIIEDQSTGTEVEVALVDDNRIMTSNALPNHETGTFPNSGNPNSIQEQSNTYEFPLNPSYTGVSREARVPGVALNGVKFEPGTAEIAYCENGIEYRIEALQDVTDLGLDFNNAHVQPTGAYHYHGVSEMLVSAFENDQDIVHIGFAVDGHLMVYSKSGAYRSSYVLDGENREGVNCNYASPGGGSKSVITENSPAGTFTSDWVYSDGSGDLDECNGAFVSNEYVYFITEEFPYVPRCLKGEFEENTPGGGGQPGSLPGARPPRR